MTENIEAQFPCVRGCTRRVSDTETAPLIALKGSPYCARCRTRALGALRSFGHTTEHIIRNHVAGLTSKADGRRPTKGDPPLPFNVEGFNDANEIYNQLTFQIVIWAKTLKRQLPTPAANAWRNRHNRIVGLPVDVSPNEARYAVVTMARWLELHLDNILSTPLRRDDIDYFLDEITRLGELVYKYPTADSPKYSKVAKCPDDDARLIVYPPRFLGDDRLIICEACGRLFPEDEFYRNLWQQQQDEAAEKKGKRALAHLTRKYGA